MGICSQPDEIHDLFSLSKVIAVVGLSSSPSRPSHYVSKYLQNVGYKIIPVNPFVEKVLGEYSHPVLANVTENIDIVDVFRKSEDVMPIVLDAIKIGVKCVWMQEGVVNVEAAKAARDAGLLVLMDS